MSPCRSFSPTTPPLLLKPSSASIPNSAVTKAEALSRNECYVGAVAFSRSGDPATGDFGDALFRTRRKLDENEQNQQSRSMYCRWLQVRVLSEPRTKSIADQSPVCGRGASGPKYRRSAFIVKAAACIALAPKNSTIKTRRQLISFLFAVAPNRTTSL